eukprot:1178722-Prorocentrum_minimum.AAC.7
MRCGPPLGAAACGSRTAQYTASLWEDDGRDVCAALVEVCSEGSKALLGGGEDSQACVVR